MAKKKVGICDFETTLHSPVSVWLAGVKDLQDDNKDINTNTFKYFTNFKDWFYYVLEEYTELLFHNEKFDGSFIMNELFKMGFQYFDPNKKIRGKRPKTPKLQNIFTCDMDLCGSMYEIKVQTSLGHKLVIHDSLKLFQFSVSAMGESLNYPKLTINENNDYSDYTVNDNSIAYLHRDIDIPRILIKELRRQGHTKRTIASCSLASYKKLVGKKTFDTWFPSAQARKDHNEILHRYCNQAYDGGMCFPYMYQERKCGLGVVLDNNSLYPSRCLQKPLPYGKPITDDLQEIDIADDYIQYNNWQPIPNTLTIMEVIIKYAHIKDDYIPCIRSKECNIDGYTTGLYNASNPLNPQEKWLSTIQNYHAIITEVDYQQLLECYENVNIKIVSYMRFKSQVGMFDKYFKYWGDKKKKHGEEGNNVARTIDKMFMNSLTGKFGTNLNANYKIPYLDNDTLKFTNNNTLYGTFEEKDSIYVPVICFITAWGRYELEQTVHKIGVQHFNYDDTDSIHMSAPEDLQKIIIELQQTHDNTKLYKWFNDRGVWIDSNELGAWAIEAIIDNGKYIRAKTYIENIIAKPDKQKYNLNELDVKACGMSDGVKKHCNFSNFRPSTCWCTEEDSKKYKKKNLDVVIIPRKDAKLMPKQVKGGCLLVPTGFTINKTSYGK